MFVISVFGQSSGFHAFTELPDVPFEATTTEQDTLIEQASSMRGDNVEAEPVAACDALIADDTLVFELRCWAVRQKMKLCTYARREWEALDAGRAWVSEHSDSEGYDPLPIRLTMANVIATRGHEDFIPLYADVKAVFDDLFSNHPSEGFEMADAHLAYSSALGKLMSINPALHYEAVEHLGKALDIMERARPELINTMESNIEERGNDESMATTIAQVRSYYEGRIASIRSAYERGLAMQPPAAPSMTEEEYVNEIKKQAEGVRLVRQQRIEQGIENPDSLGYSSTEAFQALKKRDVDSVAEKGLKELISDTVGDEPITATIK